MGLIHLAEERDQWPPLVNTVMSLWDSIKFGEFVD